MAGFLVDIMSDEACKTAASSDGDTHHRHSGLLKMISLYRKAFEVRPVEHFIIGKKEQYESASETGSTNPDRRQPVEAVGCGMTDVGKGATRPTVKVVEYAS